MAIGDDFSVAANGDIRYVGSGTNYTVISFHRWLGDLMDDAQASGNDILDITDATASERSTDNYVTLNSPYNIDDIAAQHLYDGSIVQDTGNTIYDGIVCYAPASTYLYLLQNGNVVSPNFWTTALNADATAGISHRFMVKVRTGGSDIDGRRLIGLCREWNDTFAEFKVAPTSRGNNTIALAPVTDLNNQTAVGTIAGYTGITNTEGYRGIDVNGDTTPEYYYSEWNKAAYSINVFYERMKFLARGSASLAACTDTGGDFAVGNGTIVGQGQAFANGVNAMFVTRVFADLKKTGSPTGNIVAKIYDITGSYGTTATPTGAALATSKNVDVSKLTTSYVSTEFGFDTQYLLTASTNYVVTFEYSGGDGSNYVQIRGLATTGTHGGNRSEKTGAWAADADDDLRFDVYACPQLYEISGEKFRGITHEIDVDTPGGTFQAVEPVTWSGGSGQMLAINSTTSPTKMWIQLLTGIAPTDGQTITGYQSTATCDVNTTVTERTLSYPFCGASTGSAIIGSYGFGIEATDLTASDKLFDLTNAQRVPPNNVTFTVSGLVASEDRVLVTWDDSGIDINQMTLNGALTTDGITSVVVNGSIPSDTPTTGTIRIQRNSGIYSRHTFSNRSGSTFTIASSDFLSDNASNSNNVYISYIDKVATATDESFTVVYSTNRTLFYRVRDGGGTPIKTIEGTGTLGSAGGSVTINRITDA